MKLELKQIFELVGERLPIEYDVDLSDYELYNTKPFATPVHVTGEVFNEAGVVQISYTVRFTLKLPCDRCLDIFTRDYEYSFQEILVNEENPENDEYIPVPGCLLELDDLVLSDVLLSLPAKQLCREDCKGLCPKCGVNWNHETCQCSQKEVDPRLAVLGELLK